MVHKPLYVVPSSLSAQFGQEIMKFFPTKKVFVTTKKDFVKARRKQFVSRIITGDYDAIVIGDSQFEKIPVSKERQMNYIEDKPVSYTHLTLPTIALLCRSRWSPYH